MYIIYFVVYHLPLTVSKDFQNENPSERVPLERKYEIQLKRKRTYSKRPPKRRPSNLLI